MARSVSVTTSRSRPTSQYLSISGALAAVVMLVFSFVTRGWTDAESLAEIFAETILLLVPIEVFSFMLQLLRGWAKPLLLGSVMLGIIAIGSGIARLDGSPARDLSLLSRAGHILKLAAVLWVPMAIFVTVASQIGPAILVTNQQFLYVGFVLFLDALVFAVTFHLFYSLLSGRWIRDETDDEPPASLSRRALIGRVGTAGVALAGAVYLGDLLVGIRAGAQGDSDGEISEPVTPEGEFYTVSKNFLDPSVSSDGWTLQIGGLVENPYELSYDELRALPTVEQMTTLTCISNEVGGDLIDNAHWTGVRLADLIEHAGISGEPLRVAFHAHDGYSDSFEIEKALDPDTIVAYLMNGEPLPDRHGYPARLLVPGKYGIKNGKWLRRIELVDDFRGYWQARGWTQDGTIKTMSAFEKPVDRGVVESGPVEIGGVAFAGDRGISRVEYSTDDGETWRDADELNNVGPLSWTIWRATWTPAGSGAHRLAVRATDGTGEVQTADSADPLPDGASGYHRIVVGVT